MTTLVIISCVHMHKHTETQIKRVELALPDTLLLVSCPDHTPRGERRSGERSRISWAYYRNVVRTNEIARLLLNDYVVIALNTHKLEKTTAKSLSYASLPLALSV